MYCFVGRLYDRERCKLKKHAKVDGLDASVADDVTLLDKLSEARQFTMTGMQCFRWGLFVSSLCVVRSLSDDNVETDRAFAGGRGGEQQNAVDTHEISQIPRLLAKVGTGTSGMLTMNQSGRLVMER
jgi:hypothetical protein